MRGHLPCRDTFPWIQKCPFKAVPEPDGLPCVGPSSETQDCNVDQCPECVKFTSLKPGLKGTRVNCIEESNGNTSCTVSCRSGKIPNRVLANPYYCGPTTNYVWSHRISNPKARLPSCMKGSAAKKAKLTIGPTYDGPSKDKLSTVRDTLCENARATGCVQSGVCNVTCKVTEAMSGRRRRRDTTTKFQVLLSVSGNVPHFDYFPNGTYSASTEAAAVTDWAFITESFVALDESIQQADKNGSLSVIVDGVKYAPINGSWLYLGETICPSAMVTSTSLFVCGQYTMFNFLGYATS
ncbi:hypothetical protein LSAT2_013248 [Lamellibrachia satsuma]|nr:hypothetical protein LSAT2_013248 [Lamellibrachia satsuma]